MAACIFAIQFFFVYVGLHLCIHENLPDTGICWTYGT